jgi:hypothetical protein
MIEDMHLSLKFEQSLSESRKRVVGLIPVLGTRDSRYGQFLGIAVCRI